MRFAIPLLLLVACGPTKTATGPTPPTGSGSGDVVKEPEPPKRDPEPTGLGKPVTTSTLAAIGLDPTALDRRADPCDDFYQFACGGWIEKTQIPADKSEAMRSFVDIEDRNVAFLHDAFEKLVATPDKDPAHQKIATYYAACMNEPAIEKAGVAPLAPLRTSIDRVKDVKSLSAAIAQLHAAGYSVLFEMGPTQDSANAKAIIIGVDQGGLGLPDIDYYLKNEPGQQKLREAYAKYIETLLVEAGHKAAHTEALDIIALETELAKVSKDRVARRDPKAMYNKIDKAGLAKAMPGFDWPAYWNTVGLGKQDGVDVAVPSFFAGVDKLLAATKPEVWRAYLTFHLVNKLTAVLTSKIEQAQFALQATLTGQEEMEARWKRCVGATTGALADLVGQLFIKERFAGASKTAAEGYVHAIRDAMADDLAALPWMDTVTKAKSNDKLKAMDYQIGYPNKWRSYGFKLDRKTFAANSIAATRAETAHGISKIGKPLDLDEWEFPAPLVNAFYSQQKNYMLFPAGILQQPFYNVDSSVAANLGAMGMVVGHEMTHGFDDKGSQFDAAGNLVNWWQPETRKLFDERIKCVVDQYSNYEIAGVKLTGARTVGENVADIGGVKLALAAMRKLRAAAPDTVVADGFTEDQQFFLSFGQAWCAKARPDFETYLATVDTHSPPKWRINGTLSDTPDFAKAFHCKAGAKLAPAKQCVVW